MSYNGETQSEGWKNTGKKLFFLLLAYQFHTPWKLHKLCSGTFKNRVITSNHGDVKACRYVQRHDRAKSPDEIAGSDRISDCVGQFSVPVRSLGVYNLSWLQTLPVHDLSPQSSGWSCTAQILDYQTVPCALFDCVSAEYLLRGYPMAAWEIKRGVSFTTLLRYLFSSEITGPS